MVPRLASWGNVNILRGEKQLVLATLSHWLKLPVHQEVLYGKGL